MPTMSVLRHGNVMMEFVTSEEMCAEVMLIVKHGVQGSVASMAARMTVFILVSQASIILSANLIPASKSQWITS